MTRPATKRAAKRTKSQPKRTQETRERLLEAAGQAFAEYGYGHTTAKDIARRARTNPAAVNYYFGGIDELYLEVIKEARRRSVTYEKFAAAIQGKTSPEARLQAMLDFAVQLLTGPFASSWMARIFAREMVSPSPLLNRFDWRDTEKRFKLMRELIGDYVGLPPEHPEIDYATWSLIAPISLLLMADRKRLCHTFSGLDLSEKGAPLLTQHLARFALGGLQAIASQRACPKTQSTTLDKPVVAR